MTLGPIGMRYRPRALLAIIPILLVMALAVHLGVTTGRLPLGWSDLGAFADGSLSRAHSVVLRDRLVGISAALLVGAALGMSGALTQTITRNPIATADILGVTAGASAAAVMVIIQPRLLSPIGLDGRAALPIVAIIGGTLTTLVVLGLAWRGGFDGLRLILVGLGVNALCIAAVTYLMTRADLLQSAVAARWLSGSVEGTSTTDLTYLLPVVLIAAVLSAALAGPLAALRLGRDVAASIGTPPGRTEAAALVLAVVCVGVSTAAAGPIAFVAFMAPHAARRLFGTAGPTPLAAALIGAVFVATAHIISLFLPVRLPVGIITSIVGAPFLLWILLATMRRTSV